MSEEFDTVKILEEVSELSNVGGIKSAMQKEGNSTYVFECTTDDGNAVYIKSPKYGDSTASLISAMSRIKYTGVNAPEILSGPHIIEAFKFPVYVESGMAGVPLQDETFTSVQILLGISNDLRRLHSLCTAGFGRLDDEALNGRYSFFEEFFYQECDYKLKTFLEKEIISTEEYEFVVSIREQIHRLYEGVVPAIVHGDLREDHIYTKDDNYCGIIDFGDVMSGDPVYDLAHLAVYSPSLFEKLKTIYDVSQFENFEKRFTLLHLYTAIKAYYYGSFDNPDSPQLRRFLEYIHADIEILLRLFVRP